MKYEIKLITPRGPITEIYTDSQDLKQFESEMITKYGEFIMLSSKLI